MSSPHQQPQKPHSAPHLREQGEPTVRRVAAPDPGHRRGGVLLSALHYAAIPMAFVSALWITAGRALFGAGGDLMLIFAVSFGPALLALLLVAWGYSRRELKLHEAGVRAGLPPITALVLASTWVMAGIFGMLVPDRLDGRNVSASATLLGQDFIGLSAAFGNTTGILTFSFAVATLLLAISDYRKARALRQGLDSATREELERQESMYDFLD
ncbi:hypothetical protein [Rothia nasimurium]|uniref:hypothetical protein n=1 Tax=Rothia nasimurium TaxID=85336 RepID=UPI00117A8874|nr:hypothetical protein [Rothia nasimurium]